MSEGDKFVPHWIGDYELLKPIGVGGMSEVFLARTSGSHGFKKVVVVKRILRRLRGQSAFVELFINEAKRAVLLQHANIVQILQLTEHEGWPFIVMEYVHGADLRDVFIRAEEAGIELPVDFGVACMVEALKGLSYAHELVGPDGKPLGIIHRDVTPENIFVSFAGEVKLGDFGVAHFSGERTTGELRGKCKYAAPEVLEDVAVDCRADVFSAGVVLWELLTLEQLFTGQDVCEILLKVRDFAPRPPSTVRPKVAADLDRIVLKAIERDRDRRYQSAGEFERDLSDFLYARNLRWTRMRLADIMRAIFGKQAGPLELPAELPRGVALPADLAEGLDHSDATAEKIVRALSTMTALPVLTMQTAGQEQTREQLLRDAIDRDAPEVDNEIDLVTGVKRASPPEDSEEWVEDTNAERLWVRQRDQQAAVPQTLDQFIDLLLQTPSDVSGVGRSPEDEVLLPELAPLLYWDSLTGLPIPNALPVFEGSFKRLSATRLLYELTVERTSGTVLMTDDTGTQQRLLSIQNGAPIYVHSDRPRDASLAALYRHQLLPPSVLFQALLITAHDRVFYDDALVQVLTKSNAATASDEVRRTFAYLNRIRLRPVFGWQRGHFAVYREIARSSAFRWDMPLLTGLLLRSVRGSMSIEAFNAALRNRGENAIVLKPAASDLLKLFHLRPNDQAIVNVIDGRRGLLQLLQRLGAHATDQQHRVLSLIYVLAETRLAELL
ncbi:MAG: serine/threonine protein kinase [Deltaproteobacteria bacterium]|nr:serine/threonine protein kinase [Deltaproteobacteria bacterium]